MRREREDHYEILIEQKGFVFTWSDYERRNVGGTSYTPSTSMPVDTFRWSDRASDRSSNEGAWSVTWKFDVK